ncbi:DUF3496 domain-containing protein [Salmonella enterica]|nr:DUF3496 domain-containing protein [Salmonella enterica]EFR2649732.1 DUF3496 domain-containing protein [Salmonella enterica]EFS1408081.1 DUF3496 domain-containing protein [Salmonella enterica]EHQ8162529.1 DUF3496 domain-containing protein [Salmonella enterica]EJZ9218182.1 DUF3496 domain-containing protein [Salmonella enterica]
MLEHPFRNLESNYQETQASKERLTVELNMAKQLYADAVTNTKAVHGKLDKKKAQLDAIEAKIAAGETSEENTAAKFQLEMAVTQLAKKVTSARAEEMSYQEGINRAEKAIMDNEKAMALMEKKLHIIELANNIRTHEAAMVAEYDQLCAELQAINEPRFHPFYYKLSGVLHRMLRSLGYTV